MFVAVRGHGWGSANTDVTLIVAVLHSAVLVLPVLSVASVGVEFTAHSFALLSGLVIGLSLLVT